MSVDLAFLVLGVDSRDFNYSHTLIDVGGFYDYHQELRKLRSYDPPSDWSSYIHKDDDGEARYGHMTEPTDPYGDEWRMYKAGDIAQIDTTDAWPKLNAATAYVQELDPDTWIIFYWH